MIPLRLAPKYMTKNFAQKTIKIRTQDRAVAAAAFLAARNRVCTT